MKNVLRKQLKKCWKNWKMLKTTFKQCWTKLTKMLKKKLDTIPDHPNNYTDSELFWKNLPQYSIPTLIRVPHWPEKEKTVLSRVSPPSVRERSLQILRQYKRFFPFFNQWIGWREYSCWITCFICHQIWKRPAIFPWNQFGDCTSSSSCFHAVFVFTAHKA